jgi:hypothetical protein
MMVFTLRLRGGFAHLRLPTEMTQEDFDRIVAMMQTLVLPEGTEVETLEMTITDRPDGFRVPPDGEPHT